MQKIPGWMKKSKTWISSTDVHSLNNCLNYSIIKSLVQQSAPHIHNLTTVSQDHASYSRATMDDLPGGSCAALNLLTAAHPSSHKHGLLIRIETAIWNQRHSRCCSTRSNQLTTFIHFRQFQIYTFPTWDSFSQQNLCSKGYSDHRLLRQTVHTVHNVSAGTIHHCEL